MEPTVGTSPSPSLVLGIDTGGTYTDGVLLEYHSRQVVASHKSLTTRGDSSIGIERVIDAIHIEQPADVHNPLNDEFNRIDAALVHARAVSRQRVLDAALRSGADHPEVIVDERSEGLDTYRVQSRAFGNPRLGR